MEFPSILYSASEQQAWFQKTNKATPHGTTPLTHVTYLLCVHYMTKSMWTPARQTSHSKIMGINVELVPTLLPIEPPLFCEGFPLDAGTLLWGLASIQPQEH
jgi:hypothetical protein